MLAWIATFLWLGLAPFSHADDAVRVLITDDVKPIQLNSLSPVEISTGPETIFLNHARPEIKIEFARGQWVIHVKTKYHKETYQLRGPQISLSSITLSWNGQQMMFPVQISYRAKYSMVGVMSMNQYLRGVVTHEMPSSWPIEAVKAQVVASRTYALWKKRTQQNDIYDLRPSVMDQVYRMPRVGESTSLPPSVETALRATEDMYLTDKNQRILKAYFHSDCGGSTSSAEEVWGQSGSSLGATRDVACEARPSGWSSRWSIDQLRRRLMSEFVLPPDLKLMDVVVRTQSESSRVEWLDMIFSKGIFKRVRGEDVRRLLGYDKIKSTMFAVEKSGDTWVFNGRGFGHGVGMCQHGARAMAKNGKSFKEILAHYYPSAILHPTKAPNSPATSRAVSQLFEPVN